MPPAGIYNRDGPRCAGSEDRRWLRRVATSIVSPGCTKSDRSTHVKRWSCLTCANPPDFLSADSRRRWLGTVTVGDAPGHDLRVDVDVDVDFLRRTFYVDLRRRRISRRLYVERRREDTKMADKTYGTCACGCGESIAHEGSSYAGGDEATRNRHRARAAYKRKQGGSERPAGTREALAALGLADDVPVAELAERVSQVAGELARRAAGLDSAAVAREIERGLADARGQVEAAEERAAKAEARAGAAGDELSAAVARADQADADAAEAGQRAEDLETAIKGVELERDTAKKLHQRAEQDRAEEIRRADRAEALLAELREQLTRVAEETRARVEAEAAVRLAETRAELAGQIGELRAELATTRAERDGERARAERAEARMPARRTRAGSSSTSSTQEPTEQEPVRRGRNGK